MIECTHIVIGRKMFLLCIMRSYTYLPSREKIQNSFRNSRGDGRKTGCFDPRQWIFMSPAISSQSGSRMQITRNAAGLFQSTHRHHLSRYLHPELQNCHLVWISYTTSKSQDTIFWKPHIIQNEIPMPQFHPERNSDDPEWFRSKFQSDRTKVGHWMLPIHHTS